MATSGYEVLAVRYAWRTAPRSELYFRFGAYHVPDEEIGLDYYFWVLREGERTILVDTGFSIAAAERRGFRAAGSSEGVRFVQCSPVDAFAQLGIDRESVDDVIITHLHWDHIGNLEAFPDATLLVPERELNFWTGQLARREQFWEHVEGEDIARLEAAHLEGRVRTYGNRAELARGVRALSLPGHSPGQHGLLVESANGPVVLASDATHYYEEMENDWPFMILVDIEEMYESYEKLRALAADGAVIVPGHDPEVAKRFPRVNDVAVRIE